MPPILVFDLDDTLTLERDYVRSGFKAVDKWLLGRCGAAGLFDEAWRLFETGVRGNIFDLALPSLGLVPERALIQKMVTVYRSHRPNIELTPDARHALNKICRCFQSAVLTDGFCQAQSRKVEVLALERWCKPVIITDRWGRDYWKPHVRGFEVIQGHFGTKSNDFVYIGDNPAKDFIAPRYLGWRTIRIRRPEGLYHEVDSGSGTGTCEADVIIESLVELERPDIQKWLSLELW